MSHNVKLKGNKFTKNFMRKILFPILAISLSLSAIAFGAVKQPARAAGEGEVIE